MLVDFALHDGNKMGEDFNIYSSWMDYWSDTNAWTGSIRPKSLIGFPGDCGPSEWQGHQWISAVRSNSNIKEWSLWVLDL